MSQAEQTPAGERGRPAGAGGGSMLAGREMGLAVAFALLFVVICPGAAETVAYGIAGEQYLDGRGKAQAEELAALARILGDDPMEIYTFVRDEIAYDPLYGLLRSPYHTMLQRSGTAADQAALLVTLLRALGHEARYVVGEIRLTVRDVCDWIGIVEDERVVEFLALGGMPVQVTESQGDSEVVIPHVWVRANFGGEWRVLDPSFRRHTCSAGMDVGSAMGYEREVLLAVTREGATIASDQVVGLNVVGLTDLLRSYAGKLADQMRAIPARTTFADIMGGRQIPEHPKGADQQQLSYAVVSSYECEELPGELGYYLSVKLPGIEYVASLSELADKRVTVFFSERDGSPELRVQGTLISTGMPTSPGQVVRLDLALKLPGGITKTDSYPLRSGGGYALAVAAGTPPYRLVQARRSELAANLSGTDDLASEGVLGEALYAMALAYMSETFAALTGIAAPRAGVLYIPDYMVAIARQEAAYGLDIRMWSGWRDELVAISASGDQGGEAAFKYYANMLVSALEGTHIEQLQGVKGLSAVSVFADACAQGVGILRVTRSNVTAVLPLLQYDRLTLDWLASAVAEGAEIVIPERRIPVGDWMGSAYLFNNVYMIGASFGGVAAYKGVYAPFAARAGVLTSAEMMASFGRQASSRGPALYSAGQQEWVDLELRGEPPRSLGSFRRTYTGVADGQGGALGAGWMHSFDIAAVRYSDWLVGLGRESPIDAVGMLVAAHVAQDLLDAAGDDVPLDHVIIAMLVTQWGVDQLVDNVVVVRDTRGVNEIYARLPDGTYSASTQATGQLLEGNDGCLILHRPFGEKLQFDSQGRLRSWQDCDGNQLRLLYDHLGRLVSVTDTYGRSFQLGYSGTYLTSVKDPLGRAVRYEYDSNGRLERVVGACGGATSYEYNDRGFLAAVVDAYGTRQYEWEYDAMGRVVAERTAAGLTRQFVFAGSRILELDTMGRRIEYCYDQRGNLRVLTDAQGARWQYDYDVHKRLVRVVTPLRAVWSYEYDKNGNIVAVRDPLSGTTTYEYDAWNRVIRHIDPRGAVTEYQYGEGHHLLGVVDAGGHVTRYVYGENGQIASIQRPTGTIVAFEYDAFGYLKAIDDGGRVTLYEHDVLGRLVTAKDPMGQTWRFSYDCCGALATVVDDSGRRTEFSYDAVGRLSRVIEADGRAIQWTYDDSSNTVRVTRPDGHVISFAYNDIGLLREARDAAGLVSQYAWDHAGRLLNVVYPSGQEVIFRYDAQGRLAERVFPSGKTTWYEYDLAGNLVRMSYSDKSFVMLEFDLNGNLVAAESSDGWREERVYDVLGRPTQSFYPAMGRKVEYTYDALGRTVSLTLVRGDEVEYRVEYSYTPPGDLVAMTNHAGAVWFQHDDAGRLTKITYPNGIISTYRYDAAGRVERMLILDGAERELFEAAYEYDLVDNVIEVREGFDSGVRRTEYVYDVLHQLLREKTEREVVAYEYDVVGNRTGIRGEARTTAFEYQDYTLLQATGWRLEHDADGNVARLPTPDGVYEFSYDAENRVTAILGPEDHVVSISYDAFGRPWRRSDGGGEVYYLYAQGQLLAEIGPNLETIRVHASVGSRTLCSLQSDRGRPLSTVYYHHDAQGSVRIVSDKDGAIVASYSYDAFGNPSSSADERYGPWTYLGGWGVEEEAALPGLFRMGVRYYHAELGRFLSPEPLRFHPWTAPRVGHSNPYVYALNNPLKFVDPTGLCHWRWQTPALCALQGSDAYLFDCSSSTRIGVVDPLALQRNQVLAELARQRDELRPFWGPPQSSRYDPVFGPLIEFVTTDLPATYFRTVAGITVGALIGLLLPEPWGTFYTLYSAYTYARRVTSLMD